MEKKVRDTMGRIFLPSILFIGLVAGSVFAAAPSMEWFVGYGVADGSHVHEGMQTSDGGYIAIGNTLARNAEMIVSKTDSSGNEEWTVTIGDSKKVDIGICVAEVSDGFICGGGLYDAGSRGQERGLVKLNKSTGAVIWQKTYPGGSKGCIRGVDILSDGSIVATGYINSGQSGYLFFADDSEGFIMKTDSSGNIIWDKALSVAQGTKVREISGGFAVCSTVWYYDGGDHTDAVLIKTDSSGNETYSNRYGSGMDEHIYDFDLTSDGGYIMGGHTLGYGVANWDLYLLKLDSSGNEQWYKIFGNPRGYDPQYIHDEAYGVRQTPDGGYALAAGTGDEYEYSECGHPSGCSDEWKAYLVKTDSSGNLEWEGVYPPTSVGNTAAEYLGLTSDGGYMLLCDTDAFMGSIGAEAIGFMKIAGDGPPDTEPPSPDPMTWATVPYSTGSTSIAMVATTATDPSGVSYYFSCISGGGHDSLWQADTFYEDDNLEPNTTYTYTVKARDNSANQNQTAESSAESATTDDECPATDCHVEALVCSEQSCGGPNDNGVATVTIYDDCGDPVVGADVTGTFTGSFNEQVMETTDMNGQAVLITAGCVKKPTFQFCVDDVDHTLPYDPTDNLADCCND